MVLEEHTRTSSDLHRMDFASRRHDLHHLPIDIWSTFRCERSVPYNDRVRRYEVDADSRTKTIYLQSAP